MLKHVAGFVSFGLSIAVAASVGCGPSSSVPGDDIDASVETGNIDAAKAGDAGHQPDGPMSRFDAVPSTIPDAEPCTQTTPIVATGHNSTPDMLIVLDKSGSMNQQLPMNGGVKMTVMKSALDSLLPATNTKINWGLMTFPSDSSCGVGTVTVGVAPNNASTVVNKVNNINPGGATPTPGSLDGARSYFAGHAVNPDGRYVLLATDGQPNCAPGDPQGATDPQAIQAVKDLYTAGIKTFVIGVGDTQSDATLQAMAVAGGTTKYYPANSPADLQAAFAAITQGVTPASCTFTLQATDVNPELIAITLDGTTVMRDTSHTNGWDYNAQTNSVTFYGATCTTIQSGSAHAVNVDYGCHIISRPVE